MVLTMWDESMTVEEAIFERRSCRAFLDRDVSVRVLEEILVIAQRAPSWCNVQPWRIWITRGLVTERLAMELTAAALRDDPIECDVERPAEQYPEPLNARRRQCGRELYRQLGIERGDDAARKKQWLKNYRAFDSPHIAVVAVHRDLGGYGPLDVGCWLQSFMLVAMARGVGTCAQASLARYPAAIRRVLEIPDELNVLCGIAIGYPDPDAPENKRFTSRSDYMENATHVG